MNRILVLLLLTLWPALSSAKDPTEICPRTLKFLKDPLPQSAELYRSVMLGLVADLKRENSGSGATQAELFCNDARARLWDRLLAGAPSEITNLPETKMVVGDYYFQLKDYPRARDAYYAAHQADPSSIPAALKLAKIAELTQQREAQRAYLEIVVAKVSKDPQIIPDQQEAFFDYAKLAPRTEAENFIRKTWAKAFPKDHRRALALLKISESADDVKLMKEGTDLLGKLAPDARTSSLVVFYRGLRYSILKDYPRAQADLQSFLSENPHETSRDLDAVTRLVEATTANKDWIATEKWLEWAFDQDWMKDDRHLRLHETSVRFEDHEGVDGLAALKKALAYHSKSLPLEAVVARRALVLAEKGEILKTQAQVTVENLEMDYPQSPESAYLHGRYLRLAQQFTQAQVYFNNVQSELQSGKRFSDDSLRNEFLSMGAENALSAGKPEAAKAWVDWALTFSDLSKEKKEELETLKTRSSRKKPGAL